MMTDSEISMFSRTIPPTAAMNTVPTAIPIMFMARTTRFHEFARSLTTTQTNTDLTYDSTYYIEQKKNGVWYYGDVDNTEFLVFQVFGEFI